MVNDAAVRDAVRELGHQLAARRQAAGYCQVEFAPLTGYGRSTLANVETGRQHVADSFWRRCDQVLGAGGELVAGYAGVERLRRQRRVDAALIARTERLGQPESEFDSVVQRAVHVLRDGSEEHTVGDAPSSLGQRVLDAWTRRREAVRERPLLTLVGGFPGSGKTEFSKFLASITGWNLLDKDVLTRPLTETLLTSMGADPHDRHTQIYRDQVRPTEYRSLLAAAFLGISCDVSTVAAAPFVAEFWDPAWLARVANRCAASRVELAIVWLACDVDSMHEYIRFNHFVVDNSLGAAMSLADQACALATQLG